MPEELGPDGTVLDHAPRVLVISLGHIIHGVHSHAHRDRTKFPYPNGFSDFRSSETSEFQTSGIMIPHGHHCGQL